MKTEMVICPYCSLLTVEAYYADTIQGPEWREMPCTNRHCENHYRDSRQKYCDVTSDYDDHSDADSGL